jgi:two-component system chemotaxis response regulator CheB
MPISALRHVGADFMLPVSQIAPLLARLVWEQTNTPENAPVSRLIEIESKFVEMQAMSMKDMDALGSHAGFSCPECHGPIWKIKDGTLQRYRCHVGHAYTAQTMVAGQIDAQETHLWQALRLMKERVSLIAEIRSHAPNDHSNNAAHPYDAEVKRLEKKISLLQEMVEDGPASSGTT